MEPRACHRPGPELWGGIECTVSRIGAVYRDQLELSGHAGRVQDLDLLAGLGLRALRYPLLWERLQPDPASAIDWRWADERLSRLRGLGIRPVVGLVHHGSGPRHTSLLDPSFAAGLADFGRAIATRFPWVDAYTPVNEPLTTARFSALYGHWYPHRQDAKDFCRALLGQCRAVVLTMRAIRTINPAAQLVQTEDLGKTFSTPPLAYQADFENERRWVTWDLLCGRVDRRHPLWSYFRWVGLDEPELTWFLDNPCPPDLLGVNYYVTSERFLDHRLERYPRARHGGNGRHRYVDTEAVRARPEGLAGLGALLAEAWERYARPIAVTEVHLGCTREEQMRWFWEAWQAARHQWQAGADIRAVTAWALLGTYDWDSLLTRSAGHYEPAAFDVRGPRPRPTGLAALIRAVGAGIAPSHPVLARPGWWRRRARLLDPAIAATPRDAALACRARPVVIVGTTSALGQAFVRLCRQRGIAYRALNGPGPDAAPTDVQRVLAECRPWAVIHAASYGDSAGPEPNRCHCKHPHGAAAIARACVRHGIALLAFSSDQVFDGRHDLPYLESAPVNPVTPLGRTQAAAEAAVLQCLPAALVVRTSGLFGPWDEDNPLARAMHALALGQRFSADDAPVSPTYVPHLVHACLDLLVDGERGIWHLTNHGTASWADLARRCADLAGLDPEAVDSVGAMAEAGQPRYRALGTTRGRLLPSLQDALECYFRDRPARELAAAMAIR